MIDTPLTTATSYSDYINPQWVALLDLLDTSFWTDAVTLAKRVVKI